MRSWSFACDDADRGRAERWWADEQAFNREIVVPFPPESAASEIHDPGYHPVAWYRRTITPQLTDGRRLILHFGAVDHRADVWSAAPMSAGTRAGTPRSRST